MHKDGEYLGLAELPSIQQAAWLKQRDHLADSAFYRTHFKGLELPKNLHNLDDLPMCSKSELRVSQAAHPPFGDYLGTPSTLVNRLHRTSGTTGQAMNLALSAADCKLTEIVAGRCQKSAGLGPEHTVIHCLNYQMWMGGLSDHMGLEQTGATVVPFGVGSTELLIRTIRELSVTAISCTPSYLAVLQKVIAEEFPDLSPADLGLKLGLFGGESGLDDPAFRERIEGIWGLSPRNANYGVSDVLCNFAAQCGHDTHLHFMAADVLYAELIDPQTEEVVPIEPGAKGELVLTHLERQCQPLVRFRTGDIISIAKTDTCQCRRTGFRFRVIGRSDDMVVVRGLNLFPTMIAAVLNGFEALSGEYRIKLDTAPPYDFLPVEVELKPGRTMPPEMAAEIEAALKKSLGATARVTVLPPGSLPVTEGKTARVVRSKP